MLGAQDAWAVRDWEQSPPALETYATPIQLRAWRLKMGLATEFACGSTPEQIFQASQLIWNEGFGCLRLFEDALAYQANMHIEVAASVSWWRPFFSLEEIRYRFGV